MGNLDAGVVPDLVSRVDKIDAPGMSDIALWVEEAIVFLADREQPLRVNLTNAPVQISSSAGEARQASLGTIPEFGYAGEGVQISGVTPTGAAEEAGLQAGDILLTYDGERIEDLQSYSNFIRGSAPGDIVSLQIRRSDEVLEIDVVLKSR